MPWCGAGFSARYARARAVGLEKLADELIEIGDDSSRDWTERNGELVPDHEVVNRSRLRCDNRKWLLARLLPRRYGDRVTAEVTGDPDAPIVTRIELIGVAPRPMIDHEQDTNRDALQDTVRDTGSKT